METINLTVTTADIEELFADRNLGPIVSTERELRAAIADALFAASWAEVEPEKVN